MRRPAQQHGLSQLEFVTVLILLLLMILVALNRLLPLRGEAEAAAVLENDGVMRAALGHAVARRVIADGMASLPALQDSNPMALMATPPPGYVGSQARVDVWALAPGAWAFDESRGVLIYRLRYPQYFTGTPQTPARVEWRVHLIYAAKQARVPANIRAVLIDMLGQPRWLDTQAREP